MPLTYGSLFSGLGGLDLGLERAGLQVKWQVEINDYGQQILNKHWPSVPKYRDVRTVGVHNLAPVDIIVGGDPCQENSNARQNTGLTSPSLGGQFVRIVDECRPRLVLRENPSAVRSDAPWPWFRFRSELERLGYVVLPFRLRACCLGADHRRERLFLLATLPDTMRPRLQRHEFGQLEGEGRGVGIRDFTGQDRWDATPRICRAVDGIPNRIQRIKGLGNAVCPHVGEFIGRRIIEADQENSCS